MYTTLNKVLERLVLIGFVATMYGRNQEPGMVEETKSVKA
jgi:hypothetical protein